VRLLTKFLFAVLLLLAAGAASLWWWASQPLELRTSPLDFRIAAGSSLRSAITQMREAGIDVNPTLLALLARLNRADTAIKAGSYAVKDGVTPRRLLNKLLRGKVTQGELTLVEGWTLRQWRARLDRHPDLVHESLDLSEAKIIEKLGLNLRSLEGQLFPDTYLFDKQSSDLELLARAHRAMQEEARCEWENRDPGLPYRSPYEALDHGFDHRKGDGARVPIVNWLLRCSSIAAAGYVVADRPNGHLWLGEKFDGNLRKRDLQADSPTIPTSVAGLPPTPIAMPGQASIQAALTLRPAMHFISWPAAMAAASFRQRSKNTTRQSTNFREAGSEREIHHLRRHRRCRQEQPCRVAGRAVAAAGLTVHVTREPGGTGLWAKSSGNCCCTRRCTLKPKRC
jgi:UPF0755 protein